MSSHATPASITSPTRYSHWVIAMHWLMAVLIIAVVAAIDLRELYPKGSAPREAFKTWHFMLGLSVGGLVWLRLLLRIGRPAPVITPTPVVWQNRIAKLMHIALYALMLVLPLLGWLALSAKGKPIPFFFELQLPTLMAPNKEAAKWIEELHEAIATAGYFLVGGHAAAALFHHYVKRDNTLLRMLPGKSSGNNLG